MDTVDLSILMDFRAFSEANFTVRQLLIFDDSQFMNYEGWKVSCWIQKVFPASGPLNVLIHFFLTDAILPVTSALTSSVWLYNVIFDRSS